MYFGGLNGKSDLDLCGMLENLSLAQLSSLSLSGRLSRSNIAVSILIPFVAGPNFRYNGCDGGECRHC